MNDFTQLAQDRLERERDLVKQIDSKYKVVYYSVYDALLNFVKQDDEFAQAVVQSSETLADCCKEVTKGCGSVLPDIEAYRRAVRFYFPGAEVRFEMKVDLIGDAGIPGARPTGGLILNLEDFI